jgi:hypothetical protein
LSWRLARRLWHECLTRVSYRFSWLGWESHTRHAHLQKPRPLGTLGLCFSLNCS